MTRRIASALFALLAFGMLSAQRDPILVPEVSQHEIQVRQGFTGTELLLFGAILDPSGTRAGHDYDIVVVLKGPTQSVRLREKRKVAGVWINAESSDFRSAPSFFAVASSRPISQIVDDPHFLEPIRAYHRRLLDRLLKDGSDPENVLLLYLAIEGLRSMCMFDLRVMRPDELATAVEAARSRAKASLVPA